MQIEEICGQRVVVCDLFDFPGYKLSTELGRIGKSQVLLVKTEEGLEIWTEFATVSVPEMTRKSVIATRDRLLEFIYRNAVSSLVQSAP